MAYGIASDTALKDSAARERSILFAPALVAATLAGRKTQTRRLMRPQPGGCRSQEILASISSQDARQAVARWVKESIAGSSTALELPRQCPLGKRGDLLWVRESWGYERQFFDRSAAAGGKVIYAAHGPPQGARYMRWKPSLHMPRRFCRIRLEIQTTTPGRLQDLTVRDAQAEGCPEEFAADPLAWFRKLWDSLCKGEADRWCANPWVWAITFQPRPTNGLAEKES